MEHLLLLHGAIGASDQLEPLAKVLRDKYQVHTLNFSGHGGRPIPAEDFSIELFANDVLRYLQETKITAISIFGYSMGGYVAMWLAKHHPEKVKKVITLATKYSWDESIAAREIKMLDPSTIQEKLPAFAEQLRQRHSPVDWKIILQKTKELILHLGSAETLKTMDYETITHTCLLLLGDRDKMVSLEETLKVYKNLPSAQLAILPATPHPIEQTDPGLMNIFIERFIQ